MTNIEWAGDPEFTIADRLRKARERTGLDQGDFAARADMSRTTVVNYEQGHRPPRMIYIRAWAAAAGVSVQWIQTGIPADLVADAA